MKTIASAFLLLLALAGADANLRGHARVLASTAAAELKAAQATYQQSWAKTLPQCAQVADDDQVTSWATGSESTSVNHSAECPAGQFLSRIGVNQEWWGTSDYGIIDIKMTCSSADGSETSTQLVTNDGAPEGSWSVGPHGATVGAWSKNGSNMDFPVGMPLGLTVLNRKWGDNDQGVVAIKSSKAAYKTSTSSGFYSATKRSLFAQEGGEHFEQNCYTACDKKTGTCSTNFCGTGGVCCRKGWHETSPQCGTTQGGNGMHMCTRTAANAKAKPAALNSDQVAAWVSKEARQTVGTFASTGYTYNHVPLTCPAGTGAAGFDVSTKGGSGITNLRVKCRPLCTNTAAVANSNGHWSGSFKDGCVEFTFETGFSQESKTQSVDDVQKEASLTVKQGFKYDVGAGVGTTDITIGGKIAVENSKSVGSSEVMSKATTEQVSSPETYCKAGATVYAYQWMISGTTSEGADFTNHGGVVGTDLLFVPANLGLSPACPPSACDFSFDNFCSRCNADACALYPKLGGCKEKSDEVQCKNQGGSMPGVLFGKTITNRMCKYEGIGLGDY